MFLNSNIPLVDSNVLISYLTQDGNSQKAKKVLSKGCYYNEFILCEVLNFIQNKYSHNHSILAHNLIFTHSNQFIFAPTNYNLQTKTRIIRQKFVDNSFTFTDSLILAQAEESRLIVYTDDDRMANYKKVQVINPNY